MNAPRQDRRGRRVLSRRPRPAPARGPAARRVRHAAHPRRQTDRVLPRFLRPPVAWLSRTRLFRWMGPRIMPGLERVTSVFNHGRTPLSGALVPSLVLHTTGAKTREPRRTELMYCPDGADMLVTGSNFAGERHPAWTANLAVHPEAVVEVRGRRIEVLASRVPEAEREATWVKLEANWPGYRKYERAAGRELRIFRLTPR
ncbi:MAG: nitroreductase family deazaflavin-dependent oxidoreductase [Microbacteriaceae bacterium]|nr:nitroreductase family deazaflavin-dependent oxidoreductase [Microbacteriaceae bacterium]